MLVVLFTLGLGGLICFECDGDLQCVVVLASLGLGSVVHGFVVLV